MEKEYTIEVGERDVHLYKYGPQGESGDPIVEIDILLPDPALKLNASLEQFYVRPRADEGDRKYKGEGKKALCFLIGKLVKEERLDPETVIELDAYASPDPTSKDVVSKEESDAIMAKYPNITAEFVEEVKRNRRLVAYYETYGFKVVPGKDSGNRTPMTGTVGGILTACSKTGGKKRACSGGYTRRRAHGARAQRKRFGHTRGTRRRLRG